MMWGDLVANIPAREERLVLASEIILLAEPITFGFLCLKWFKRDTDERPNERGFSLEDLDEISRCLARRISIYEGGPAALITEFNSDVTPLLYTWSAYGNQAEVNERFHEWFEENPESAISLLLCYLPTAWGMESGLSHKGDFELDQYKAVTQVINPETIIIALERIYSDSIYVEYDLLIRC